MTTDARLFPEPPRDAITFWGHACTYLDFEGSGIVTDPVFASSYSMFHARKICAPPRRAFDRTDVILISHAHYDHLNVPTLERFATSAVILCPRPAARHLRGLGMEVRVVRPGDAYDFSGGTITAVVAHHPGGRNSLRARADGRALGYVIETPGITVYYSGDTEYFPGLARIGDVHRPDVALLNVTKHLPPDDALFALVSLNLPKVIPMHMGAYGGPRARGNRKRHHELMALIDPIAIPLEVGESVSLKALRARPAQCGHGPPIANSASVPHVDQRTFDSVGRGA